MPAPRLGSKTVAAPKQSKDPQPMSVNLHSDDPTPAPSASNDPDRTAPNCAMVIFGAGGDLTKRLVVPALYNLAKAKQLPDGFALIGVDLADKTAEAWRDGLHQFLEDAVKYGGAEFEAKSIDEEAWGRLTRNVGYVQGDLTKPETYEKLDQALKAANDKSALGGNALFYLAVADRFFGPAVDQIGASGLADEAKAGGWRRVVIEKPFGHDLVSAKALDARVLKVLREDQIYRIDHSWARRRSRTSWRSASATACSSRCGTATGSTMSRSQCRRRSASKRAASSTSRPAPCATWCRTMCSS
jgi:hypothetical protein